MPQQTLPSHYRTTPGNSVTHLMTMTTPATDAAVRACLLRLMNSTAEDPNLASFHGKLWITVPDGPRLRAESITGNIGPNMQRGTTFPQLIGTMAAIYSTPYGHIVSHLLLDPDLTGMIAIGRLIHFDSTARALITPRPEILGLITQYDGRRTLLRMDEQTRNVLPVEYDEQLSLLITNLSQLADTLHNMIHAPLPADTLALARQMIGTERQIFMPDGTIRRRAHSDFPGTGISELIQEFLDRASQADAQMRAAAPQEPEHRPGRITVNHAAAIIDNATKLSPEPLLLFTDSYRTVE